MKPSKYLHVVFVCTATLAAAPFTALGQIVTYTWDVPNGEWDVAANWLEGLVPAANFDEVGAINNGGTATVSSDISTNPGGVLLGNGGADSGTLHIQSGGSLDVVAEELGFVNGAVTVGGAGTGTLIIDRGGMLSAASLRSGGNAASSIVLGGGNAGMATLNVSGNSSLARQTSIIGPNVAFTTEALSHSGALSYEINASGNSMIMVNDVANLGGTLNLDFTDGFVPAADQTFDIIDAAAISGRFSTVTSNIPAGPGLAYVVQSVAGGVNGTLAQVEVDVQLLLQVNRRTGESQIRNLAEDRSVSINGYGVISDAGIIDDSQWAPFDAGGPWRGNGSSTHVTELSLDGSRAIGPGDDISLGNLYAFAPAELGDSLEDDLTFEYHIADGDVVTGAIDLTGAHNNLVLVVDDENGVFLQNQSEQDISINGYAILSESNGLVADAWNSFVDGGNADWTEANAASNHITELTLDSPVLLEATSDAISLGSVHAEGAARDLEFLFNIAGEGPFVGVVEYDDGVIQFDGMPSLEGDYNGSGGVEQGDLDLVLLNWGETLADPQGEGWINDLPSGAVDQEELDGVLLNWGEGVGATLAAAQVPEPATWMVLAISLVFGMIRYHHRVGWE